MDLSRGYRFHHLLLAWRAKLVAAQRPSLFDRGQLYVPWEDVGRITDPENVTEEAVEHLGVNKDVYTELVQGRERILCTLIYSHLTHKFLDFCYILSGHECLPLECNIENGDITVTGFGEHTEIFSEWKKSEIYDFYDSQWRFAVPLLKLNPLVQLEILDPVYHLRTVFPFDSATLLKRTPFSRVWKVKIHTSHVDMGNGFCAWKNEFVALKESTINVDGLRVNADVPEALNERRMYIKLSRSLTVIHNVKGFSLRLKLALHLTELHWAFRRQNTHFMIFPWAEGGSLGDFWHDKDPMKFTATELHQWMKNNIIGLLGGVHALHKLGCCHGDLKPGNILVFSEQKNPLNPEQRDYVYEFGWAINDAISKLLLPRELGILKITDFGTARANLNATMARTRDPNALIGAQRYAPPEFDRNELAHNSPRSRSYDVWSMGCILLEFIIWACYGGDSVGRFSSRLEESYAGRFWTYGDNRQKTLHPYVRHQFRKLKRRLEDTGTDNEWLKWVNKGLREYLLQLLEVVRTQMLVVNLDKEITATRKNFEDSCTDDEGSSSEGTDDERGNSKGTGTVYRASAQTLFTQFFELLIRRDDESVEEEDQHGPLAPSTEESQATLAHRPKTFSSGRGDSEEESNIE